MFYPRIINGVAYINLPELYLKLKYVKLSRVDGLPDDLE